MCGIAGALGIATLRHREEVIQRMTRALIHRGPDEEGYYQGETIALGHRRLSIIDLSTGRQPIANETGTVQLVCNGEIYNSPALRKKLMGKGHRFSTATDVEVIVHLYEEYGCDCLHHLRGMFAFALWDQARQRLLLARDHMGQKPLFYYHGQGVLLFASEVKSILASGLIKPAIDRDGLWHYVSMRYIPDQYSLFRGIHKIPAGSYLLKQGVSVRVERYWKLDFTQKLAGDENSIADELDHLLRETVRLHLLSDVRVGAFLSGGIDSGIVASMMAMESDRPVPVFSIGVQEQRFNELPYARRVVERHGMEGHEKVARADLIHLIPWMIHHMDEPSDPFGVGVYLVSHLARDHVKVVLAGDGGDESFAGYDRFVGQRLADFYAMLPRWLRLQVMSRLIGVIPESFGYKTVAQKAKWINEMSLYSRGQRYAQSMAFLRFTPDSRERLFTPSAKAAVEDRNSTEKILRYFDADRVEHLVDRMLYTDLMTRMPDHLLVIADRMTMAHSLENRSPLVDYQLVEFAASIPAPLKLKGTQLKYILKKVASRYLPEELIHREKQGFSFPIGQWMRNELRGFMMALYRESRFVELDIFSGDYLGMLLDEHLSGKSDHNFRLWIWLNLELWYRMYFENQTVAELQAYTDKLSSSGGVSRP